MKNMRSVGRALGVLSLVVASTASTASSHATRPGLLTLPYPTLHSLSVQWSIQGDSNRNGMVTVNYREVGGVLWNTGMPLRRVPAGSNAGFTWTHRHTGSILDLKPNTEYEIVLRLQDPDGGSTRRTVRARTRAVPAPMPNAPVRHVTPADFAAAAANAQPGDVLELAAGTYEGFTFEKNGTAGKPIVIRSKEGAEINGNISLNRREYVHLEGLHIKGRVRFNYSKHIALMRNTVTIASPAGSLDGLASRARSENAYIADNVVTGPLPWAESSLGQGSTYTGEGIVTNGPGHVVMNNRVEGFHDGISLGGREEAADQYSIDIANNDIEIVGDDAIEADHCFHNCRVMRNRISNVFTGLSSQPSLGGPTYFLRNAMYNVIYSPFKLHNNSTGNVILHNTVVKNGDALGIYSSAPFSHTLFHNNLLIGGPGGTYGGYSNGDGRVIQVIAPDPATVHMNHDAFGSTTGLFQGRWGSVRFSSLQQLRDRTTAKNSIAAGLDSFATPVAYPSAPLERHSIPDLRLRAGAAPEDKGVRIANINDDYVGQAPDMGAYEFARGLPVYGPRPEEPLLRVNFHLQRAGR